MAMKEASISDWENDKIGASIPDGYNALKGASMTAFFMAT
jgi:hypothetical protein